MQSVHADVVQTHFVLFAVSLKKPFKSLQLVSILGSFGGYFVASCVKTKKRSRKCFKKSATPDANGDLFTRREVPGEGPSCARFLNKKQEFEQESTTAAHF